jgi:MtN3 and saliva related transmembrane protein
MLTTIVGLLAAIGTTASHVPQLLKAWRTGETSDLSLRMLCILWSGLALWVIYGLRKEDLVIILSNAIGVLLLSVIIGLKLRGRHSH